MTATMATTMVETWITGVLVADTTVHALIADRIYSYVAPRGALFPCVVIAATSAVDITPPGGLRFLTTLTYAVKAIDNVQSLLGLDAIAARIDTLLHNQQYVPVTGGMIASCVRTNIDPLGDAPQGREFRQLIQTYKLQVQGG